MIAHKKEFYGGFAMLVAFFIVLAIIFMPLFHGHNGLNYLDSLYNSISKGSAYYIPKVMDEAKTLDGRKVELAFAMNNDEQADQIASQLMAAGAMVNRTGIQLKVSADLGLVLQAALADADAMYNNDGAALSGRYGFNERQALFNWWTAFNKMDSELKRQKLFKEARITDLAKTKAVETAYNYYGIQAEKITGRLGVVVFSLVFYVIYTLWYGFAILFIFEGWGLSLEH
ncbi:MAG: hypothetical protein ABIL58_20690 [Pseudomonadota bacterium]